MSFWCEIFPVILVCGFRFPDQSGGVTESYVICYTRPFDYAIIVIL